MLSTLFFLFLSALSECDAFAPGTMGRLHHERTTSLQASNLSPDSNSCLAPGDAVLLVGPGFLQLNVAKAAKAAGLRPVIVAPQQKIDSFAKFVRDDDLIKDATIGMADPGEPFYGEIAGVVFCAEEAVLQPSILSTIIDWKDRDIFCAEGIKRVVACAPITEKVNEEKSMGWMPLLNNDKKTKENWKQFANAFKKSASYTSGPGSLIRFGSLLGGSIDGSDELQELGLDEGIYKMSLENYRDLKERSFDRYRIGAQVLLGDTVNVKPPNQDSMEKEAIKESEQLEAFRAVGGYPEQDRTNRHVVAQAVVQSLLRSTFPNDNPSSSGDSVPKEFTVLSKCEDKIPTKEDWDTMFSSPGTAKWPDPFKFDAAKYGFEEVKA